MRLQKAGGKISVLPHLLSAMRPLHWVKNLLVFIPPLGAGILFTQILGGLLVGFVSLSLAASAIYLVNDVLDKPHDGLHESKKYRAVAAGHVSPFLASAAALVLLVVASLLALGISVEFVVVLGVYVSFAMAYSVWLKKKIVADVVVLSLLFVLRIVAGAVIVSVPVSEWLLVTSFFIFFSIATGKRTIELMSVPNLPGPQALSGRGYLPRDLPIIQQVGLMSGLSSAVLFGLFIDSVEDSGPGGGGYSAPELLWVGLPLWVFWVARFWILVNRGLINSDPVIFAVKDGLSYAIALSIIVIVLVAQ